MFEKLFNIHFPQQPVVVHSMWMCRWVTGLQCTDLI